MTLGMVMLAQTAVGVVLRLQFELVLSIQFPKVLIGSSVIAMSQLHRGSLSRVSRDSQTQRGIGRGSYRPADGHELLPYRGITLVDLDGRS